MKREILTITISCTLLFITVCPSFAATFTPIDFPGAVASIGTDINDSGQIVGEYTFSGLNDRQGFLLSNGVFTSITYPGATSTRAVGINSYGDIVGDHHKAGNNFGSGNDYGYLLRGGVFTSIQFPNRTPPYRQGST